MTVVRALLDRFVPRGALTLAILSLGYFASGLVRNRVFAGTFGAGPELDAYNAAFRIPEIALDILVASGLSAPFVPIFARLLGSGDDGPERAAAFGRTVLTGAVAVTAVAMGVLAIAAPFLADTVFGAFDPATRELYVELLRINCLAQVAFAASIALGEVLVARRQFLWYGLAPILYTGGIVLGSLVLGPQLGIHGAAFGALGGALAHLGIRAIGAIRSGFRPGPAARIRTAEFREFIRLMVPRMLSYPIDPIVVLYLTVLAARQGPGTATSLSFVLDYQFVPVQVFAITFSLAIFPSLAGAWADGDRPAFVRLLRRNVATIAVLTSGAALGLAILADPVIGFFLGGGRFGPDAVRATAALLAAFALSIPIDALAYPLSRALYATHNTVRQVVASIAGLATLVVAAELLVPALGTLGIPAAYVAGGLVKLALLAVFLGPRVRVIGATAADEAAPTASR